VARTTHSQDVLRLTGGQITGAKTFFQGLAALGIVASVVGMLVDRHQFGFSYLVAFLFGLTMALGCLFFVMIQHLARAGWSVAIRRMAEVAAGTLPLFVVLFLPVLRTLGDLYPWSTAAMDGDHLVQHKEGFLNIPFFVVRAAVYFGVWILIARYFLNTSIAQDTSRDPMLTVRMQRRAAPAMILFAFTLTFMSFDWLMSMQPHWYSTIFGVYIFAGAAIAGFAFLTVTGMGLRTTGQLRNTIRVDHYQDLGRLLFAFSVFWTYIAFSQFFLIWYGNMPEETIFYVDRIQGSWRFGGLMLAVGHFAVPFVLLMSRWTKRRPGFVTGMAGWMLFIHYWDIYWLVMPNLNPEGIRVHWMDASALAAVVGLFVTVFLRNLERHALVPAGDPRLSESLALEHLY
jgi:hypothetical protein